MFALTLKNVLAHKARMALITLAVVIGVSFVSSTFIFSDSLSKTFTSLVSDISTDVDLEVRTVEEFGSKGSLTNDTVQTVASIDGVRQAVGIREEEGISPITSSGDLVETFSVGLSWVDDAGMNVFSITEGAAPIVGEFVMSANAAEADNFIVGQSYKLATPTGVVTRTLAGLTTIEGGEVLEANLVFVSVPLQDAQDIFGGDPNQVDSLSISVNDQATASSVQAATAASLGDQFEVVNQRTIEQEQAAQINGQVANLRNLLLGFAVVSLFVSTFIIYNTFGIVLNQRVREIGLLRAIGADAGHIGRSVIGEALIIGLVASVVGLIAGLGLNAALVALLNALGASFPDMETVISTRTVLLAFAIGIGVTVISALGPARRASRIAPVTAMRGVSETNDHLGRRVIAGSILMFFGALAASYGLFTASGTQPVLISLGLGVVAIFLGVTLLSPALARPVIDAIGAPFAAFGGASGALARGNASRNRRRTANTAASLMVGLALISTAVVVGQSVKQHLSTTLDETVSADFVISDDFEPITSEITGAIDALDEVGSVVAASEINVKVGREEREAEAVSLTSFDELFDVSVTAGSVPNGGSAAMLSEPVATELGLGVGDTMEVRFDDRTNAFFEVAALFTDTTLLETGMILDRSTVMATSNLTTVDWVAASIADGGRQADTAAALQTVSADFPRIDIQTTNEYRESIEAQVDQLLSIINVMLALSILIALIGIGLTLALSVYERTREIGLLRAVGMSRRQVRRMVRWEAALIATFGAVLGVGSGMVFGWGAVSALPDAITSSLSVPTLRLAVLIVASAIAGVAAALLPARRAGRMNVLDAITGR